MGRRMVAVEDLVDAQAIADRLGLAHRGAVDNFGRRDPTFPAPLGMWGRTRLWDWSEVATWARSKGRLELP